MSLNDLMITNMIFSSINKINTGYIIFDIMCMVISSAVFFYFFNQNFKQNLSRKIDGFISRFDKTNKLIFSSVESNSSKRYRAIMHYVSKSNDPSVRVLSEIVDKRFNRRHDDYIETNQSGYKVDQNSKFNIDKSKGIMGKVFQHQKERSDTGGRINFTEYFYLEVFSTKMKLLELEKWVEDRMNEYNLYIKSKSCDNQLLVEVGWNPQQKDIDVYYNPWASNVTFENRFFTNKDEIVDKINFFINNPEWYKKRGIPYTLGFLLWGEPGCGKTGFIKAIMNQTGRHGISIKLNNQFDLNRLREIIYDDEIDDDLIIPQSNRILIFEDIDCMGEVVKDRDIKEKEDKEETQIISSLIKKSSDKIDGLASLLVTDNNFNNNLSFFLNILDGLQECPGRIIIMTTNKPELLDKALIRPGRIDFNIEFTKATTTDIKNIIQFYWNDRVKKLPANIDKKFSHAEIVNFCRTSENIEETIKKLVVE